MSRSWTRTIFFSLLLVTQHIGGGLQSATDFSYTPLCPGNTESTVTPLHPLLLLSLLVVIPLVVIPYVTRLVTDLS